MGLLRKPPTGVTWWRAHTDRRPETITIKARMLLNGPSALEPGDLCFSILSRSNGARSSACSHYHDLPLRAKQLLLPGNSLDHDGDVRGSAN